MKITFHGSNKDFHLDGVALGTGMAKRVGTAWVKFHCERLSNLGQMYNIMEAGGNMRKDFDLPSLI